ncbi:MAG: VWA domain-containing protein [Thermodesulfovibrionales bacterium]
MHATGYRSFVCFLCTAVCVFFLCFRTASAVDSDTQGIDAVLLIDSSGSMKKTDPKSYRKPAAKMFLSLMGEQDRISIVSFSDSAEVLADLTGTDRKDGLQRLSRAVDLVHSRGAHTNLHAAVEKAYDLLKQSSRKQRLIILMTDGKMDLGDPEKDRVLAAELKTKLIPDIRRNNIRIHSLAFSDQSDQELLREIARLGDGSYLMARSDRRLHLYFVSLFERIKSPDTIPVLNDSFVVDDSVREMTIMITRKSAGTSVIVVSPSGGELTARNHDQKIQWFESPLFDMVTLMNPDRGKWTFRFNAQEGNKVFIVANLKLLTSFNSFFATKGHPLKIDAWLEREKDQLNVREILDQVVMKGIITLQDGRRIELKLADGGTGGDVTAQDGICTAMFQPLEIGDYTLQIIAEARTFKREKEFRFTVIEPMIDPDQKAQPQSAAVETPPPIQDTGQEEAVNWVMVIAKFAAINLFTVMLWYGGRRLLPLLRNRMRGKQ